MTKSELEHVIRAAGAITQAEKVIILGSQAILAQFPFLPESSSESNGSPTFYLSKAHEILFRSMEADIMIPGSVEKTELVEGTIGELSLFHRTFGYYAQGVDFNTSKLPEGWENRLVEICNENTNNVSGLCLEIHDLIISKLYAGRKKDQEFFKAAINLNLLSRDILMERLRKTSIAEDRRRVIENFLEKGFSK